MKNALVKLVKVKSMITLVMLPVFAYLSVTGRISAEEFTTIFATVIAFYFGTQAKKEE